MRVFLPEYTDLANRTLDKFSWDPNLRPQNLQLFQLQDLNLSPRNDLSHFPTNLFNFLKN